MLYVLLFFTTIFEMQNHKSQNCVWIILGCGGCLLFLCIIHKKPKHYIFKLSEAKGKVGILVKIYSQKNSQSYWRELARTPINFLEIVVILQKCKKSCQPFKVSSFRINQGYYRPSYMKTNILTSDMFYICGGMWQVLKYFC